MADSDKEMASPGSAAKPPALPSGWQAIFHKKLGKTYFYNEKTKETSWAPPPPVTPDDVSEKADDDACPRRQVGTLASFLVRPPPEPKSTEAFVIFDEEETGARAAAARAAIENAGNQHGGDDEETRPKTAMELTFKPDDLLMQTKDGVKGILDWCSEFGIEVQERVNGTMRNKLKTALCAEIRNYFRALHKKEGTDYFDSRCFQTEKQPITRDRSLSTNEKRKIKFDEEAKQREAKKKRKTTNKSVLSPAQALKLFPKHGFYTDSSSMIRCACTNKALGSGKWDKYSFERHLKSKTHTDWAKKAGGLEQPQLEAEKSSMADEPKRMLLLGTRNSSVTPEDDKFRIFVCKMLAIAGIPSNKLNLIRKGLEEQAQRSLIDGGNLMQQYVGRVLQEELDLLESELKGKLLGLVFDATPRLGDVFAQIGRYVEIDEENGKVAVVQRLFHVEFLRNSMNADHVCHELNRGLQNKRKKLSDVVSVSEDGCRVNLSANAKIAEHLVESNAPPWFVSLCISHCASNAGDEAGFPLLDRFWRALQTAFANSEAAKCEWQKVTLVAWMSYSDTRWFSKFDVEELIFKYFPDLETVLGNMLSKKVSPESTPKLLLMITSMPTKFYLQIELCAIVEGLQPLRRLCCEIEGDGQVVFYVGKCIDRVLEKYPVKI